MIYAPCPTSELDALALWKIKMTTTGNNTDSTYTWTDSVSSGSSTLSGYGVVNVGAQPNQELTSISLTTTAVTTRSGTGVQIGQSYTISVDNNGNIQVNKSGTANKVQNNLGVSIAGHIDGEGTKTVTFNYEVASTYDPSGITGFGLSAPSGAGFSIEWEAASSSIQGMVPTIRFEAIE